MATKVLLPNQHDYLHPFYGAENCCLCKAEWRIQELEKRITQLEKELPTAKDLHGMVLDFTGDMKTEDYIRSLRE